MICTKYKKKKMQYVHAHIYIYQGCTKIHVFKFHCDYVKFSKFHRLEDDAEYF